ncbi:cobaltochelatase subunit CobN [Rhodobaculum claviforme]|uniref:Cobaltochelatase subunit CobN n=1 Tax=Rhodobaculum claviforme TaxID=1549854 RepID=A0A934TLJ0_9RHOB|nr:cobaltochelatase subunit CobN [Rhodobaculum claviforme]MBK5927243.1 cobaltochelatase subunit CobN [Rhodobaculum claviforme]
MHVVFRESHGLDDAGTPVDLGQAPADLVVLSFSDSDLGAFAAGWHGGGGPQGRLPSLRLANLAALKHPLSVDTYVERTLSGARGILIRLIGGRAYWAYGLQQVRALAAERGIALAVLPADGRADAQLDAVSTLPVSTLRRLAHLCDAGGAMAARATLAQMALAAGLYAAPVRGPKGVAEVGAWTPEHGACCPLVDLGPATDRPRILLTFYRAYLTAADLAPMAALHAAFRARGCDVTALFAPSLKAPEAARWLARQVAHLAPAAIVNATAFSARGADGTAPLDAAGVPVFQVALATSSRQAWAEAERGLSPADLAMHVVLPEVDGRVFAGVASFKEPGTRDADLQFARHAHAAHPERIDAIVGRVLGWVRLARTPGAERRPALVLSSYPGKGWQMAHAVGLDALASAEAVLEDLAADGVPVAPGQPLADALAGTPGGAPGGAPDGAQLAWPIADYHAALAQLPQGLRDALHAAWGPPEDDPAVRDGAFHFNATRRGEVLVALQPERGQGATRDADYHDLGHTPRHGYVAFYLWLRAAGCDVVIHMGAHGTLEWLPGKAVALSSDCWPEALIGPLPVIYPFIVNDPGEAAQAKRRIGAVTLGHIPPPLRRSATPDRFARLEALLDEFSNADGLDPARRDRLQGDIRAEARALGVEDDLGLATATCAAEAITRIDRFVCDIKDSQFGDGLHVFGRPSVAQGAFDTAPSAAAERAGLRAALAGARVAPGPSGSPFRGRRDVLPTGRNLYTTDPRAVPTCAAHAQGVRLAGELVRRHLQDHGDWPRGLVVDLWGSATMRTAGEDFAMALHLLGCKPLWDEGSDRVSGVEVLPIAMLDRPRIDVTLRVSGLFRDVFPSLSALFQQAVRALAARDEAPDWNPYAGRAATARVYGPAPGRYGLGLGAAAEDYTDDARRAAGQAWLAASSHALDGTATRPDPEGIAARLAGADAFVHAQDLPETDLLLAADYAAHEAGFAAAQAITGGSAALYHLDNTDPDRPRARTLGEEIARVVRARAANPAWIAGMRRHGFRGAAEIAATLDHLAAFAHLAGVVPPHLFDLYHEATLGDAGVSAFMADANPGALAALRDRFAALARAGLWRTRSNSIAASLPPETSHAP